MLAAQDAQRRRQTTGEAPPSDSHAAAGDHARREPRAQAERLTEKLARELARQYPKAAACLRDDLARMTAFFAFPKPHWKHLRTTNIIESNFDVVRSRSNVCKRLRQPESATYLVWALLMRRKGRWRRFNGYTLLAPVHQALLEKRNDKVIALQTAA